MERRCFHFYGRVQGVGFRYRAHYAANLLDLTGWVGNLPDGSVLMEAQGEAAALDKLVQTLKQTSRWIMIEDYTMRPVPLEPGERSFRVRMDGDFQF